ncbi:lipoamide acyltransferase component of branched-chain alpha-keto acid dehydrogenase complex, mitochondrial-like [Panonychus citri]|uniref:lipoamide acyltransferase component of branched-chain alpha-keto acid dehydrogenase complex, mitochondrial-like n=1 Tax=Panonychus citri TaxID=50023 RepID=UPI002307278F|nr:lipoamide acyltransferase component of branched-chain alpha-keto acid dehydrogenase complex, mitochondrial-like [Panonychus citri]XP_053210267.1 lipoamide acyltransferase component of branched-chain alpha-keto acid dehydrogenase complex, mitochondrial-like [Panonychus citri]
MYLNHLFLFNNLRNNLLTQGKSVIRIINKSKPLVISKQSNVSCAFSSFNHHRVSPLAIKFPIQSRLIHTNSGLWSGKLVSFNLSDIGEGISEVVVKEWFIKTGDEVNQFDSICEVQSDKASVTITSRYDGVIEKIYYEIDEIAKVGKPLVDIRLKEDGKEGLVQSNQVDQVADLEANQICDSQPTSVLDWKGDKVLTTPAVRRIASENNIKLSDVKGSGRDGRILKEDLLKFIETSKNVTSIKVESETFVKPQPQSQSFEKVPTKFVTTETIKSPLVDKSVPFTAIQRAMFKSMTQSLAIPHFGLSDEVNLTNLLNILPKLREQALAKEIKLTFMPIFIKALSIALSDFPLINSSIDEKNEKIILKSSHNIGFAMDTKDGLIVPNIKHVENLSIIEIAQEMKRLQIDGANNKLRREDLTDGTITLSNIGSIGGLFGIPVIPPSQVVIGAIGQMKSVPIFNEKDEIIKGNFVNILWSADHRTIDGATLCRFSSVWKSLLQDPIKMLTQLK